MIIAIITFSPSWSLCFRFLTHSTVGTAGENESISWNSRKTSDSWSDGYVRNWSNWWTEGTSARGERERAGIKRFSFVSSLSHSCLEGTRRKKLFFPVQFHSCHYPSISCTCVLSLSLSYLGSFSFYIWLDSFAMQAEVSVSRSLNGRGVEEENESRAKKKNQTVNWVVKCNFMLIQKIFILG